MGDSQPSSDSPAPNARDALGTPTERDALGKTTGGVTLDDPAGPAAAAVLARRVRQRRAVAALVLASGLGVAAFVYTSGGLDFDPRSLRARIAGFGWLAPVAFMTVAALRPFLLLPSWPIMTAGGLLFGVVWGIVFGSLGFSIGALIAFGIARGLGRDAVASRLDGRAARVDHFITQRGALWMAIYTGLPITVLTPVHLSAGLSGMAASSFGIAVLAGFVPRTALFSVFGDAIAEGDWSRVAVALGGIGVVAAVGVVLTRRLAKRRVDDAPAPVDPRAVNSEEGRS